jgi:hypothetical protein
MVVNGYVFLIGAAGTHRRSGREQSITGSSVSKAERSLRYGHQMHRRIAEQHPWIEMYTSALTQWLTSGSGR